MLRLVIPVSEEWDEEKNEFISFPGTVIQVEHSLVSLSKWESKWKKPFLSKEDKTFEETVDYIRCMTITQQVNPEVYKFINFTIVDHVNDYINDPMTATTIRDRPASGSREIITAELIYYWMITFNIPFECQKWHLNRLLTLIKICNIKNTPAKKMGRRELLSRNAQLNASRRQALNTRG